MWLAGGGVKRGISYGATDELGYLRCRQRRLHSRPARHDAAPAGHRSPSAYISLPRSQHEADWSERARVVKDILA